MLRPFRRTVLLATLLAALIPPAAALARPRFFSEPQAISWNRTSVTIRGEAPFGSSVAQDFLLPVPAAGDLKLRFRSLTIRSQTDGTEQEALRNDHPLAESLRSMLTIQRLGSFRGVPVARLRVVTDRDMYHEGTPWRVARFEVTAEFPGEITSEPPGPADSALESGPFREFLYAALTAPEMAAAFAQPKAESPRPGPAEWQPRPELSPDFPWLRIPIENDGPLRIDAAWLTAAGVDAASLRPLDVLLFAEGRPVPLLLGNPEKSFAEGGEAVFLGQENDSPETRIRTFFLGRAPGAAQRMEQEEDRDYFQPPPAIAAGPREFVQEDDKEFQARLGAFLSIGNMAWVGEQLPTSGTLTLPFAPPAADPSEPIRGRIELFHGRDQSGGSTSWTLTLGEAILGSGRVPPVSAPSVDFTIPPGTTEGALTLRTETPPQHTARPGLGVWIDRIRLSFRGRYQASDGRLEFDLEPPQGAVSIALEGFDPSAVMLALDVTDRDAPVVLPNVTPHYLIYDRTAPGKRRLLVMDRSRLAAPPAPAEAAWTDMAATDRSADVLLIYHHRFADAVEEHAADLRDNGFEVETADAQAVYDAFSHGNLSTEAIRNFIAWAVFRWEGRRPHSVILFGDANGDGRGIARNGVENLLPVRHMRSASGDSRGEAEEFASDSWYTWLTPEDELADVLLGRVSAIEPAEALAAVHHFVDYRRAQERAVAWGSRLVAVADTGGFSEPLNKLGASAVAPAFEIQRIYADDYLWEDNYYLPREALSRPEDAKVSPRMTASIERAFNDGAAMFIYLGHGAPNLWSNQRFWFGGGTPNSDILRLRNDGRLPLVTSFTCNNATIDYPLRPWNVCIAEDFMRHEGKGAIGCFMPSGPGYVHQHEILARGMLHAWTAMGVRRHGVLAELARLNHQVRHRVDNHSRMYLFLGDPTLKLPPGAEAESAPKPAAPAIVRIARPRGASAEGLALERVAVLGNDGGTTATVPLQARLLSPDGAVAAETAIAAKVPPQEQVPVTFRLQAPSPGAWLLEAELPGAPAVSPWDRLPGLRSREWIVLGDNPSGTLTPLPATVRMMSQAGGKSFRIELMAACLASEPKSVMLRWKASAAGRELASGEVPLESLSPRQVMPLSLTVDVPVPDEPVALTLTIGGRDSDPSHPSAEFTLPVAPPPDFDVEIVADSVRVEPEQPSEGLTVMVSGTLRNLGPDPAPEFRVGLFPADTPLTGDPLRDLTGNGMRLIDPLPPGATKDFRLRWDPAANAGPQTIVLQAGSRGDLTDRNPANQRIEIPLQVRTKWQLYARGIEVRRGEKPGVLNLVARVGNRGQTPAGPVAIVFYRSRTQNDTTRLAEVVLEGVPAEGAAEATLDWSPTREQVEAPDFEPTFTIALKGSLQRVTSVSGTR